MSNFDTFDPFDDDPIPLQSESDEQAPIAAEDVKVPTQQNKSSKNSKQIADEELYALIDAQPAEATKEILEEHAEEVAAPKNTGNESITPFVGITGFQQITNIIFQTLNKFRDASLEAESQDEQAIQSVEVIPYKASKSYQVTSPTNDTYLFAIVINETTKYNICTVTFDGNQLVQIEILRKVFTPDSNLKYPLLAFAADLLSSVGAGGVYMLDGEPIILANGHSAPVYIREMDFEMSVLDGYSHIRLVS